MYPFIVLVLVLVIVGFGLRYLDFDPQIKNLVRAIVVFMAVVFVVLYLLDLLGVMHNPIPLPHRS